MCRMMALVGVETEAAKRILLQFRGQAVQSQVGPEGPESHGDGWGLVAAGAAPPRYLGRAAKSGGVDPAYARTIAGLGRERILLVHFRQASSGGIALENTHPFLGSGWAFAHNGTVYDLAPQPSARHEGSTDSERYFRYLEPRLAATKDPRGALAAAIEEVARSPFSSLTCLFTDGGALYGYRRVGDRLEHCGTRACALSYYGLSWARFGGGFVVAQEPSHLEAGLDWHEVPDGGFIELRPGLAPKVSALHVEASAR